MMIRSLLSLNDATASFMLLLKKERQRTSRYWNSVGSVTGPFRPAGFGLIGRAWIVISSPGVVA
jgi:hypothetical protein